MTIDPSYYDASFVRIARYRNLLNEFMSYELNESLASVLWQAASNDEMYIEFLHEAATTRYSEDLIRRFYQLARQFSAN